MQDHILRFAELCALAHDTGKVCRVCHDAIMSDESYHGDAHGYRHMVCSEDSPQASPSFWKKVKAIIKKEKAKIKAKGPTRLERDKIRKARAKK